MEINSDLYKIILFYFKSYLLCGERANVQDGEGLKEERDYLRLPTEHRA